jgi:hypothetical protein
MLLKDDLFLKDLGTRIRVQRFFLKVWGSVNTKSLLFKQISIFKTVLKIIKWNLMFDSLSSVSEKHYFIKICHVLKAIWVIEWGKDKR